MNTKIFLLASFFILHSTITQTNGIFVNTGPSLLNAVNGLSPNGCPLCDASVYSYCSNKMFHDACCCNGPIGGAGFGYNCQVTNCNYLYANSCYEHTLIVSCCCNNPF